jgi:hypothetical protein
MPDTEPVNERLSALAHARGNTGKIAFFPKGFVWIRGSIHHRSIHFDFVVLLLDGLVLSGFLPACADSIISVRISASSTRTSRTTKN